MIKLPLITVATIFLNIPPITSTALAQVTPDETLGANSSQRSGFTVNGIPSERIDGGLVRGSALFHSFRDFSIGTGQGVYFASPTGVSTIFTRVTGSTPSSINGTLGVLGTASFVFINPNGIQFGPGTRLNLRGSFLASTANSIQFPNGEFSAINPQTPPLLTINTPIGLQFNGAAKPILVRGSGYNFDPENFAEALALGQATPGLRVDPGQTLALIGGSMNLTSAVLNAPSGQIEIGGVDQGVVSAIPRQQGWQFDYAGVTQLAPIDIARLSLIDASGPFAGSINFQARSLSFADGSFASLVNLGSEPGGVIQATVQDSIRFTGTSNNPINRPVPFIADSRAGFVTETLSSGRGADIVIRTGQLLLNDGGLLRLGTSASGTGGSVRVDAATQVLIKRASPREGTLLPSTIQSATAGAGQSGNITINTPLLEVIEGAAVVNGPLATATGNGGDVSINTDITRVEGGQFGLNTASVITASSGGSGVAGNLLIKTNTLDVLSGGQVTSDALATGNAGTVSIQATTVNVRGRTPDLTLPSAIGSSVVLLDPQSAEILNLTETPIGRGGTAIVQAKEITLSDFGQIRGINQGFGDGGNVRIQADRLALTNGASITAATQTGQGGNLQITVARGLTLSNSQISASSSLNGEGGNILVNSGVFAALEQSRIAANAAAGRGGAITISSQGVFISPNSKITATSALGPTFDGIVQINTIESGIERAAIQSPDAPSPIAVAEICPTQSNPNSSQFIENGTGGLPSNPSAPLTPAPGWMPQRVEANRLLPPRTLKPAIAEFQSWRFSRDGKTVELIASPSTALSQLISAACRSNSKAN